MIIQVSADVHTPRVPNFVKIGKDKWIPLCAIDEADLDKLAKEWLKALKKRRSEQLKNPDLFYKNAVIGEVEEPATQAKGD